LANIHTLSIAVSFLTDVLFGRIKVIAGDVFLIIDSISVAVMVKRLPALIVILSYNSEPVHK
jgi:hypothetical protein